MAELIEKTVSNLASKMEGGQMHSIGDRNVTTPDRYRGPPGAESEKDGAKDAERPWIPLKDRQAVTGKEKGKIRRREKKRMRELRKELLLVEMREMERANHLSEEQRVRELLAVMNQEEEEEEIRFLEKNYKTSPEEQRDEEKKKEKKGVKIVGIGKQLEAKHDGKMQEHSGKMIKRGRTKVKKTEKRTEIQIFTVIEKKENNLTEKEKEKRAKKLQQGEEKTGESREMVQTEESETENKDERRETPGGDYGDLKTQTESEKKGHAGAKRLQAKSSDDTLAAKKELSAPEQKKENTSEEKEKVPEDNKVKQPTKVLYLLLKNTEEKCKAQRVQPRVAEVNGLKERGRRQWEKRGGEEGWGDLQRQGARERDEKDAILKVETEKMEEREEARLRDEEKRRSEANTLEKEGEEEEEKEEEEKDQKSIDAIEMENKEETRLGEEKRGMTVDEANRIWSSFPLKPETPSITGKASAAETQGKERMKKEKRVQIKLSDSKWWLEDLDEF